MSDAVTYTWGTWKDHGYPQSFFYFGHDRQAPHREDGRLVASVETVNGHSQWLMSIRLLGIDGKQIAWFDSTGEFWAVGSEATEVV